MAPASAQKAGRAIDFPGGCPTIGYLAPRIGDNVSQVLWTGIVRAAREQGANLICFVGDSLCDETGSSSPANVLYDLASASVLDGLVSWASAAGGHLESDRIAAFHRRYYPLPIVSITLPMEGCPTIVNDSYRGMRLLVAHMIESHGCRRLAFISGPEEHYYAQVRYRAYVDALEAFDLPLDLNLVTAFGDFSQPAGVQGIRSLLDERGLRPQVDFDAVVTVSDLLALGALEELQARGIRVPEEVALVGFNDGWDGRFATPPLTTIRLPFYEQGQRAVETLLAMLRGEEVPQQVVLPARLVIRQSCGCMPSSVIQAAVDPVKHSSARESLDVALVTRREAILNAMTEAAESFAEALDPGWAERLLDSLIAEVTGAVPEREAFLRELDHLVRPMVSANSRVGRWQDVVSALCRQMLPCFDSTDANELRQAQNLWAQARVLIGEAAQRTRGYQMVQRIRQTRTLRQISQSLVTAFDVAELADVLARDLPSLGIECCYLSLYEDPQRPTDRARLIMAYDEQGRIGLAQDGRTFVSDQLVPTDLLSRIRLVKPCSLVAEPLYFREEQIGFVLFGVGPMDGTVYDVLCGQISSALKGALLFGETREARATAEEANQAKSQFLANMSHELRTPLHAILGFAELMARDRELTDRQRVNLEIIERSGEHLLALINDVLDLSKIEAGKVELQPAMFDLHHMILGLSEMFSLRVRQKGLTVTFDLAPGVPQFVYADEGKLRQVLINLLGNAAKFTERGNITLRVKSRQLERGQGNEDHVASVSLSTLYFEIQDTGVGISSDELERLFDVFVQTESGRRSGQGTGLGLPISREYVRLMGGELIAQSQVGQGSTFCFDLPVRVIDEEQTHLAQPARRVVGIAPEQASPDGGPYRLLVVDDDEANRRLLVELLAPLGFALQEARNGREARTIWRAWRPHLIWMDANMPVLDGLDAMQEIKRDRKSWKTTVVLITANAFDLEQQHILAMGGDDFIRKPFRETQVLDTLSRHLGVRFVYEGDKTQESGQLDPALLRNVPQEWRSAMRHAMAIGDVAEMIALIDQLSGPQSLLDELRNRVYRFEHKAILRWIQGEQDG